MRPAGEPGGGQHDRSKAPNPYLAPGYQQVNPYQSPMAATQRDLASAAGPPGGGRGGGGRVKTITAVIATTVVVAAAAVVGALVIRDNGDGGNPSAQESSSQSPRPRDREERHRDPTDPRHQVVDVSDPVVADDWQVVRSSDNGLVFDVPPEWQVDEEGDHYAWYDKDDASFPLVAVQDTAQGQQCGLGARVVAGTKEATGDPTTRDPSAADGSRSEAERVIAAAYNQWGGGTTEFSDPEPFESDHGVTGYLTYGTITGLTSGPDAACPRTGGMVVSVGYLDPQSDLSAWLLVADAGHEPSDETIEQILSSLRPYDTE